MPPSHKTAEQEQAYREEFLARLGRKAALASPDRPTVRCWTALAFNQLCRQIRDEMQAAGQSSQATHRSLLEWITRLGLVCPLPAEGETFYLFDIGAEVAGNVEPWELMLADKPAGVVCYFSAVGFHGLTTQPVAYHHVAELQQRPPASGTQSRSRPSATAGASEGEPASVARALPGTPRFRYQGLPYFATRRSARMVPGIQTRACGPRSWIRITTREQTLLDTLFKPYYCGGPTVAFEAWETAVGTGEFEEERVAQYLQTMDYPATARRVGALLDLLEYRPGEELSAALEHYRSSLDLESPFLRISLFPGVPYATLNPTWMVHVP